MARQATRTRQLPPGFEQFRTRTKNPHVRACFIDRTPEATPGAAWQALQRCTLPFVPQTAKLYLAQVLFRDRKIRSALRGYWQHEGIKERVAAFEEASAALRRLRVVAGRHPLPELLHGVALIERLGDRTGPVRPMKKRSEIKGILARFVFGRVIGPMSQQDIADHGLRTRAARTTFEFLRVTCPTFWSDGTIEQVRVMSLRLPGVRQ
jgi:hypothetical protein